MLESEPASYEHGLHPFGTFCASLGLDSVRAASDGIYHG
jgi:hypothetical protein